MPTAPPRRSRYSKPSYGIAITLVATLTLAGCLGPGPGPVNPDSPTDVTSEIAAADLPDRLDAVLDYTFLERRLNVQDHAAWQILHGVLAYGRSFPMRDGKKPTTAVEYLLEGGRMRGWTVAVGRELDPQTIPGDRRGDRGLVAMLEEGTKAGQGHADQWLAVLAQAGLGLDEEIVVGDEKFTGRGFLEQVKWDLPRNLLQEYSWTLIGLTHYLPTDSSWESVDGDTWSIEDLVQIEADYALGEGACGGTHRLIGLAMAIERRHQDGLPMEGVWIRAQQVVDTGIEQALALQNADGSFSANYLARGGTTPDLAQVLGTTGHLVEFLAIALPEERLREPQVQRAVARLCDVFDQTRQLPLECGALYHAAHGLVLYRNRLKPESPYEPPPAGADTSGIEVPVAAG